MRAVSRHERILGGLLGSLIGDALGVPVEFLNRMDILVEPVTTMREYGTHRQPKGTWSDDGALILCTVDSLIHHEFDTRDMGDRFVRWMNEELWTATGVVFDMGGTTASALIRIREGQMAEEAGGRDEHSNGNGSLMRIIPIALRFANDPIDSFVQRLERVSAITHGHARSKMACVFYGLVVRQLLLGSEPQLAVDSARADFTKLYESSPEFGRFRHHLEDDFCKLREGEIVSTGYVLHTLHASLWCLLTTGTYRDCVLRAVNLGGDTDTTGCVAGGLAGVAYGMSSIPDEWLMQLQRKNDVQALLQRFVTCCDTESKGAG